MMPSSQYAQLCTIARRITGNSAEAEDIVQDAYLAAYLAGFSDFDCENTRKWLVGTVRNKALMALRGERRRRDRESHWPMEPTGGCDDGTQDFVQLLNSLTPALKVVLALALSGHNRREIAYLLKLSDMALRQRIRALKIHIATAGLPMPSELTGLKPGLDYGRLRGALSSKLSTQTGTLASHDPDGHLFVVSHSQNEHRRQ